MIARRTIIISGSTKPIFAIFSLNESVLGADGNRFVEKWQTLVICHFGIPKRNEISLPQCAH